MTGRGLKIILAASVALNIFAGAAGAALWVSNKRVSDHVAELTKAGQRKPLTDIVEQLSPSERDRVMEVLRAKAIEAHPDFEQARTARRAAISLTEGADFRPVEVAALLEQSRAAELRGRGRLEASAVDVLASLSPEDRRTLAPILSRRVQRGGKDNSPSSSLAKLAHEPEQAAEAKPSR